MRVEGAARLASSSRLEHDHDISEDDLRRSKDELERLTARYVAEIDELLDHKERELGEV